MSTHNQNLRSGKKKKISREIEDKIMQIKAWESVVLVIWILLISLKWKLPTIYNCLLNLKAFVINCPTPNIMSIWRIPKDSKLEIWDSFSLFQK